MDISAFADMVIAGSVFVSAIENAETNFSEPRDKARELKLAPTAFQIYKHKIPCRIEGMKTAEIRQRYLDFMKNKGHSVVPSSALVPENDPTTLFTGSGMQPMIQYLLGAKHPKGTRVADSQKCFRADDIEEIGDNRHTTFFEMLGNWSFGDYFKTEQIEWMWEFLTSADTGLQLDPARLYITCFGGDDDAGVPKDTEAPALWQVHFDSVGIKADIADMGSEEEGARRGMKDGERIFYYNSAKNWWSRAGVPSNMAVGEPGGPDSEMFYEFTNVEHDTAYGEHCHPNCDCGRFVEIGNNVFMQYKKNEDDSFSELENKNIDFGGGLERLVSATQDDPDVFSAVDSLNTIVSFIETQSGKKYTNAEYKHSFRIIADHMRATTFIISDGVLPSNTEQGYFVRRLLRRAVLFADKLGVQAGELSSVVALLADAYKEAYPELSGKKEEIAQAIKAEEEKFRKTLSRGMKEFEKIKTKGGDTIDGASAFVLFTTYGFPIELTEELASESSLSVDTVVFEKLMQEHKEKSRAGAEQKFKGGLADHSEKTTAFHTATHLMLAGLRKELGDHVTQRGSNITSERARFDFTHGEKVPREMLDKVEEYVNNAIQAGAQVTIEEMDKEEARESGATGAFWEKYPDRVAVYKIKDSDGVVYSRELCGGPHVENTADIAKFGTFKITKESSISAGVRRVKTVLE